MGKKILVVDDEKDILELLDTRLSSAGYTVIKAERSQDAIALAQKEKPNLILLDIVMPGMDGSEIAQILQGDPKTKNIPIIFLTCLLKKEEEKVKQSRGGKLFIAKPYNPSELLSLIAKHAR